MAKIRGAQSSRPCAALAAPSELSSRADPELLGAGALAGTLTSAGAGTSAGSTAVPDDEVGVLGVVVECVLTGAVDRAFGASSTALGARPLETETGSEEIPMCWLVSWLVAHVMHAVSTIPSSAPSAQVTVRRLMRSP